MDQFLISNYLMTISDTAMQALIKCLNSEHRVLKKV